MRCGAGMSFEHGSNLRKFEGEILRESEHPHTIAEYSAADVAEMACMRLDTFNLLVKFCLRSKPSGKFNTPSSSFDFGGLQSKMRLIGSFHIAALALVCGVCAVPLFRGVDSNAPALSMAKTSKPMARKVQLSPHPSAANSSVHDKPSHVPKVAAPAVADSQKPKENPKAKNKKLPEDEPDISEVDYDVKVTFPSDVDLRRTRPYIAFTTCTKTQRGQHMQAVKDICKSARDVPELRIVRNPPVVTFTNALSCQCFPPNPEYQNLDFQFSFVVRSAGGPKCQEGGPECKGFTRPNVLWTTRGIPFFEDECRSRILTMSFRLNRRN
ncbi:hypothetical protein BT96DRAFT_938922 [Gymnopus androsaceus JB14]|uniref:Uncharacterized protein n=1 Tax=Gymnopus androsaceus JB14 TaxID=1447944 RepID=A0A6A4HNW9_9AGAR|nr:hypothetical protein BT96DRAFT_938922 [Gymnopus androsaceus JB14]